MLRMNQIDEIKELQRQGLGPQEIAGRLKLNRKTAAKYMKVEDFNSGRLRSSGRRRSGPTATGSSAWTAGTGTPTLPSTRRRP